MAERQHTEHASKRRFKGSKAHGAVSRRARCPAVTPIAVAVERARLRQDVRRRGPSPAASAPAQPQVRRPAAFSAASPTSSASSARAASALQVNSWIGHGPNEPVRPGQLGSALGQNVLDELSQRTGMSQQELLNRLATVLPQIINHLTPNGRMPTLADLKEDDFPDLSTAQVLGIPEFAVRKVRRRLFSISSPENWLSGRRLELIWRTPGF